MNSQTNSLENVRVKTIRPKGYENLKIWCEDKNNIYIGRGGIVFITTKNGEERYPKISSPWANPYKIQSNKSSKINGYTREESLILYETYIRDKLYCKELNIEDLRNKTLGCWCYPEKCHGDILLKILQEPIIFAS